LEKQAPFLGKAGSVLGKRGFVFEQKLAPFLRKNLLGLGEKLAWDKAQGLTVLNAKHVWVWNFEVLGLGVSKNKATGSKLER